MLFKDILLQTLSSNLRKTRKHQRDPGKPTDLCLDIVPLSRWVYIGIGLQTPDSKAGVS